MVPSPGSIDFAPNGFLVAPSLNHWPTGDATIECWVKPSGSGGIVVFSNINTEIFGLHLTSGTNPTVTLGQYQGNIPGVPSGGWVYLVAIISAVGESGSIISILNGDIANKQLVPQTIVGLQAECFDRCQPLGLAIGASSAGGYAQGGVTASLARLRLWSVERPVAAINGVDRDGKDPTPGSVGLMLSWNSRLVLSYSENNLLRIADGSGNSHDSLYIGQLMILRNTTGLPYRWNLGSSDSAPWETASDPTVPTPHAWHANRDEQFATTTKHSTKYVQAQFGESSPVYDPEPLDSAEPKPTTASPAVDYAQHAEFTPEHSSLATGVVCPYIDQVNDGAIFEGTTVCPDYAVVGALRNTRVAIRATLHLAGPVLNVSAYALDGSLSTYETSLVAAWRDCENPAWNENCNMVVASRCISSACSNPLDSLNCPTSRFPIQLGPCLGHAPPPSAPGKRSTSTCDLCTACWT